MGKGVVLSEKEDRIMRAICYRGTMSRQQLHSQTRYTRPSVYRITDDLIARGLLMVSGFEEESALGRPTELLSLHDGYGVVFCLHITRVGYNTALVSFAGNILAQQNHLFTNPTLPDAVVDMAYQDMLAMLEEQRVPIEKVLGVGLALVGPIDYQMGIMRNPICFMGGVWQDVPIVSLVRERFRLPLVYDCNASACTMGYYSNEKFDCFSNMAYITIGGAIGSGMVLNHALHLRRHVTLDGFAHMVIDLNGKKCTCGAYGCVESYCSKNVIIDNCQRLLRMGQQSVLQEKGDAVTLEDINTACKAGDMLALSVIEEAASIFARCLMNYLCLVDMQAVVLGGSVIEEVECFFKAVEERVQRREQQKTILIRGCNEKQHTLKGIAKEFVLFQLF